MTLIDQSQDILAFVDEFGTPSLDTEKDGVTNLFICVAVLLRPEDVDLAVDQVRKLSQDHFGESEIRSSNIRGRRANKRRLKVLDSLVQIPFSYYALVVDKRHVFRESGLAYKRSFYRFFHRILCRRLTDPGMGISVVADRLGDLEFMKGFSAYIDKHIGPNLFTTFTFGFDDWQNQPLLQIADLVAGTLGKIHDTDHQTTVAQDFQRLLASKRIAEHIWPPYWSRDTALEDLQEPAGNQWDNDIAKACLNKVRSFMTAEVKDATETQEMQRIVLDRLLQQRLLGDEGKHSVITDVLIRMLKDCGFGDIAKQKFTSEIIGGLRDKGFVFAGTSSGMRLAMTWADIRDYLNHDDGIIGPMLSRLGIARETVKVVTNNSLDILASPEYHRLGMLVDCKERME